VNATFSGVDNTYRVTGVGQTVPDGQTYWVLVMVDVAGTATNAKTVQTRVADGYVTASSGTVNTITAFTSDVFTRRCRRGWPTGT
jgi:hypothetical protein